MQSSLSFPLYRSLSVPKPINANSAERIQEPHRDLGLRPTHQFKMMVNRGAKGKPLPRPFEVGHLDDHRDGLNDEDPPTITKTNSCRMIQATAPIIPDPLRNRCHP